MLHLADVLIAFGQNIALVLALLFVFGRLRPGAMARKTLVDSVLFGTLFGAIACMGMLMPIELQPEVRIDSRAILVALSTMFGGPISGLTTVVITVLFRLSLGGAGMLPGLGIIVTGALAGGVIARNQYRKPENIGYTHLFILGLLIGIVSPLWTIILPTPDRWATYFSHVLPVLIIGPVGTMLIGSLLVMESQRLYAETVRERESRLFRHATSATKIGVWELEIESGRVRHSGNLDALYGLPPGTFPELFEDFLNLIHVDDRTHVSNQLRAAQDLGEIKSIVYRSTWPDGSLHWYEVSGTSAKHPSKGITKLLGIVCDITERKNFELALQQSEAQLAEAQRISKVGSFSGVVGEDPLTCSEEFYRIFGKSRDTFTPSTAALAESIYEPDRAAFLEASERFFNTGTMIQHEFRVVRPDESFVWIIAVVHPIFNTAGVLVGHQGTVQDISERVAVELRVRENERLFRAIFDQAAVGVAQVDSRSGAFHLINRRYCEITGYSAAEIQELSFQEITHPEDLDRDESLMKALVAGEIRDYNLEKRYYHKSGAFVWVNLTVSALWEPGEAPDYHVAIIEDVTERKLADLALRESESRLLESQEIARIGSWEWDTITDVAWSSDILYALLGHDKESYQPSLHEFIASIHPDDSDRVHQHVTKSVAAGLPFDFECRSIDSNGETVYMLALGHPVPDADGTPTRYRGVVQDISALRRSEQAVHSREERFRRLVAGLPICVHTLDTEGKLQSINSSGLSMMGAKDLESVVGLNYLDVVCPKDLDRIRNLLREAFDGKSSQYEYVFEFDGRRRHFHSSFIPLLDSDGAVTEILGHTVDHSEAREREAALQKLVTAIDQAAESIIICDAEGVVEYVNPAFETLTGYQPEEVVGRYGVQLYAAKESQDAFAAMWKTVKSGCVWKGELVNVTRDKVLYREHATVSPVMDADGQLVNVVGVCRDITQERALEAQLLQAQKMEAIGTLAGGIAHDFNNILHVMMGYCRLARDEGSTNPEALALYLDEIMLGGSRAGELINQILTFSRATVVSMTPLSIASQLKEILRFLRSSIPTTIDIQFNIKNDPGFIVADATQIHQLVTNLTTNAFHAMEQGGGTLRISLDARSFSGNHTVLTGELSPGRYAVLQISDEGHGIPNELLKRLFDPFFTTKSVGKGTGLGLSIVHGIVTRMEGGIDIESNFGEGTTITIYLPAQEPCVTMDDAEVAVEVASQAGLRVLLVDDEEAITGMMTRMLRKRGFEVTCFNDSEVALAAITLESTARAQYDIMICDLTMPKLDGIELSGRVHKAFPYMPILLATGALDEERLDSLTSQGIRGVLRKPFNIESLIGAIHQYTT